MFSAFRIITITFTQITDKTVTPSSNTHTLTKPQEKRH